MKKAALHNLGCKVNAYETEAMRDLLQEAGYEIVPFTEPADVYVINTCSVTHVADKKSRQMLHRARTMNPDAVIVAAGCYVQTSETPVDADIVIGNNRKEFLVKEIEKYEREHRQRMDVIDINDGEQEYETLHIKKTAEHTRAFIKVQDGCNQFCSYCIIPYARGRVRSRKMEHVTEEVGRLAREGYREIVLTGIHLTSYGMGEDYGLMELIEETARIPGIERIRLGSLEPRVITEEFAEGLSKIPEICPHFHLSLQSGCDGTLQRMNRKYTTEEYRASCDALRRVFRDPALTTDVIVGFPGETEEEFAATKRFLREIGFYEMHIFKYSKRHGTRAAGMPDQVPEDVKNERSAVLLQMAKEGAGEYRRRRQDTSAEILLEEPAEIDGRRYLTGFTREYVRMAVPGDRGYSRNEFARGRAGAFLTDEILLLEE